MSFDRRVTPARADLAAEFLLGQVEAKRYVAGQERSIAAASAPLRRARLRRCAARNRSALWRGVVVYEEAGGWAWAQLLRDGYVGYLPATALVAPLEPTHRVAALRTHAYPGPSMKLPPRMALSLGALARVEATEGDFAVTGRGPAALCASSRAESEGSRPISSPSPNAFSKRPISGAGARRKGSTVPASCRAALAAAGIAAPRDSDMMEASLGAPISVDDDLTHLRRGDLVFWKGHVGVMRDAETLLHANGWHMKVVSEPLAVARARIAENAYGAITSIRRL